MRDSIALKLISMMIVCVIGCIFLGAIGVPCFVNWIWGFALGWNWNTIWNWACDKLGK